MRYRFLFLSMLLFFVTSAWPTTFHKIPLDKLIEESNGAAEVKLRAKKSFISAQGQIVTEYIFKVIEAYNLEESDIEDGELKLVLGGGTVNGVTAFIDSAPVFHLEEKSFLLLKKMESKIYLSNFTMGKYKIEESEGKTFYISSVFPADLEIGRVSKERMLQVIKSKFNLSSNLENNLAKKVTFDKTLKQKSFFKRESNVERRNPAQDKMEEMKEENGSVNGPAAMWFFFALTVISGLVIWMKLKKGVRGP